VYHDSMAELRTLCVDNSCF